MSKLHGVTTQNLLQQNSKSAQIQRPQNFLRTSLDDFKYGFPSNGLSTISNKWWGRSCPVGYKSAKDIDEAGIDEVNRQPQEVTEGDNLITAEMDKEKKEAIKDDSQGTGLLTAFRKRRMEEGREALKQGLFRLGDSTKLSKRENNLLLQIFRSSIPPDWLNGSS